MALINIRPEYPGAAPVYAYNGWGKLFRTRDGRLWCPFIGGVGGVGVGGGAESPSSYQSGILKWSTDNGTTWPEANFYEVFPHGPQVEPYTRGQCTAGAAIIKADGTERIVCIGYIVGIPAVGIYPIRVTTLDYANGWNVSNFSALRPIEEAPAFWRYPETYPIQLNNGRVLFGYYTDGNNEVRCYYSDDYCSTDYHDVLVSNVGRRGGLNCFVELKVDGEYTAAGKLRMYSTGQPWHLNTVYYESTDGGETWGAAIESDLPNNTTQDSLRIIRLKNNRLIAKLEKGLYWSDDECNTWHQLTDWYSPTTEGHLVYQGDVAENTNNTVSVAGMWTLDRVAEMYVAPNISTLKTEVNMFDKTNWNFIVAPYCWSRGNGIADKYSGYLPTTDGSTCTLTSYSASGGYLYPEGYIENNPDFGYLVTDKVLVLTDASTFTHAIKIKHKESAVNQFFIMAYDATVDYYVYWDATDKKLYLNLMGKTTIGTTALVDGTEYLIESRKNGTTMSILINGVNDTSATNPAYNSGNKTGTNPLTFMGNAANAGTNKTISRMLWAGGNSAALSDARCLADYNLGNDLGGLIGRNTAETLLLLQKSIVAYDVNGGAGTIASDDAIETDLYTVKVNTFTRTGYTFVNFNTAANGSGTSYSPGGSLTMPAADVTLFAQWAAAGGTRKKPLANNTGCGVGI